MQLNEMYVRDLLFLETKGALQGWQNWCGEVRLHVKTRKMRILGFRIGRVDKWLFHGRDSSSRIVLLGSLAF